MIEIMKASAGSGKTWNLAMKYIRLLLENYRTDPHAYRHILAVTFTNKATDEMKGRILKELHILATQPGSSPYFSLFVPALMPDAAALGSACRVILSNMLHDYAAFSVSTIDRFFQQTLKAFSRELGQFASYQVELDRNMLIHESVDRLLDSLGGEGRDDSETLAWICRHFIERVEDDGRYRLEGLLYDMADKLESPQRRLETERQMAKGMSAVQYDRRTLEQNERRCRKLIADYRKSVVGAALEVERLCGSCGFAPEDTTYGFLVSALRQFKEPGAMKIPLLKFTVSDSNLRKLLDPSVDSWFRKADRQRFTISEELVQAAVNFGKLVSGDTMRLYITADILLRKFYGLGLAGEISSNFQELLKEKNVLSLTDSDSILRGIIDGTDAPFIYEKLGVRLDHFLLDEFQDTSEVQWSNLKPLLDNSVAGGHFNLIVGDVKQSIYRWRGSDWELLGGHIARQFEGSFTTTVLGDNHRSLRNVVEFNNSFFTYAAAELQRKFNPAGTEVTSLYDDVVQNVVKGDGGEVGFDFCGKDDEIGKVLELVADARERNYSFMDIAVLVRNNPTGGKIAAALIANGIPVVTDDSLKIKSSPVVRKLIALLSAMDSPGDRLAEYTAEICNVTLPEDYHSLTDLCELLLRGIRDTDPEAFGGETLYIQSFMDLVQGFVENDGGGLHAFLSMIAEDKSSISSPDSGDSVRIMTIHKSKGLDFPYVIVPFIEQIVFYKTSTGNGPVSGWFRPEVAGTALEFADGVYDVTLSDADKGLFTTELRREKLQQYVDNLNVAYVAFTRASEVLRIVGETPANLSKSPENFSALLYAFTEGGTLHATEKAVHRTPETKGRTSVPLPLEYVSHPLGDRLSFNLDSSDFFSAGDAGQTVSARRRGIILHSILSSVVMPEDLQAAVENALGSGLLPADMADETYALLSERIASAAERGWFPEERAAVWNECSLITAGGEVLRPDRVVELPGGALAVVDYKFGEPQAKYIRQVNAYGDIYRSMGYADVRTYLWYVDSNDVVETENLLNLQF